MTDDERSRRIEAAGRSAWVSFETAQGVVEAFEAASGAPLDLQRRSLEQQERLVRHVEVVDRDAREVAAREAAAHEAARAADRAEREAMAVYRARAAEKTARALDLEERKVAALERIAAALARPTPGGARDVVAAAGAARGAAARGELTSRARRVRRAGRRARADRPRRGRAARPRRSRRRRARGGARAC